MTTICSLSINDYPIYIGKTGDLKQRLGGHKSHCFNENNKVKYNKKLYQTIRQLGIEKTQFKEYVKLNVLYENLPEEYNDIMEDLVINI